jgi:hypothetical protein
VLSLLDRLSLTLTRGSSLLEQSKHRLFTFSEALSRHSEYTPALLIVVWSPRELDLGLLPRKVRHPLS